MASGGKRVICYQHHFNTVVTPLQKSEQSHQLVANSIACVPIDLLKCSLRLKQADEFNTKACVHNPPS